jgi:hypothetical protein
VSARRVYADLLLPAVLRPAACRTDFAGRLVVLAGPVTAGVVLRRIHSRPARVLCIEHMVRI